MNSIRLFILITIIGIYFLILSNQLTRIERLIKSQQTTEQTNEVSQSVPEVQQPTP